MFISTLDIFKVGIGPSSSHTIGPMKAAHLFLKQLEQEVPHHIKVSLHGSLAFTGKGHATDHAVILGLAGYQPETIEAGQIETILQTIKNEKQISPQGMQKIDFDPETDIVFDYETVLAGHANGMIFFAYDSRDELICSETYFSVGGGFVVRKDEMETARKNGVGSVGDTIPYPFSNGEEMLDYGKQFGKTIAQMKRENEGCLFSSQELDQKLDHIWQVMSDSIQRGLTSNGELPGGLGVKRRAKQLHDQLSVEINLKTPAPGLMNEWLAHAAMAVNEENAAGGKIVTAPTNGAAGVIPAVIFYCQTCYPQMTQAGIRDFLLTAAAIGGIIKHNGSISGAEVGCQGEVGSASAMAAAGMCAVLGGTNGQIENAAEMALEHHLGMTCDPVQGLVQVPCIERNGFGAVKAVTAASLALRGDGTHFVSLDQCIKTMYQTGLDMHEKYKETSLGGLAVNMVEC